MNAIKQINPLLKTPHFGKGGPGGILFFFTLFLFSCSGTLFEEIGTHFAQPISVAVDPANNRAYVVNSNNEVEFSGASLSILDISSPAAPQLLTLTGNPISLPNFSGQIYLDAATRTAYITNRLSENKLDTSDNLLQINLDENSAAFGTITSFAIGENPFGVTCCDNSNRGLVVNGGGSLVAFDPAAPSQTTSLSLATTLSIGPITGRNSNEVAFFGDQAFVTNPGGFVYVVNLTEFEESSLNRIDYALTSAGVVRGIATDGTNLYVVDATSSAPVLRIISLASLPAINPDVATITELDTTAIQTTTVPLGSDPNEIVLFASKAYITNRGGDTVTVIDTTAGLVDTTISVGDEPFGLTAFTGSDGGNYLYVTNLADNSLSVISLASNSVVATLAP